MDSDLVQVAPLWLRGTTCSAENGWLRSPTKKVRGLTPNGTYIGFASGLTDRAARRGVITESGKMDGGAVRVDGRVEFPLPLRESQWSRRGRIVGVSCSARSTSAVSAVGDFGVVTPDDSDPTFLG